MGRFILTDKGAWDDMLHKNNEACGFRCNGYHKAEDVILRTYSKLNIDTFNYIQKGDGFAAVCGTLVYTNNTGREALELLARDLPVKWPGCGGRFRNILLMHSAGKAVLNFYRRRRYGDGILEQKQRWTDKINRLRITSQLSLKLNRNSMYHVEHYAAAFYRLIVTQVALEDGWMEFRR